MTADTSGKVMSEEAASSAVEMNGVRHVFATASPRRGGTLHEQTVGTLQAINAAMGMYSAEGSILQQTVFVANIEHMAECRQIVREFYGRDLPATSYIPQPPCDGKLVSIEATGVGRGSGNFAIDRISEQLVVMRHDGLSWVHCARVVPESAGAGVYAASTSAFERLGGLLGGAHVRFDQVVRTWLYLGGISIAEGGTQRYQELNRARSDFYSGIPFLAGRLPPELPASVRGMGGRPVYPASTGIGTEGRGIVMGALALVSDRADVFAMPLENPRQTAAYHYPDHYSPKSPKFSRAMAVACGGDALIFVSGTASITHSETRHLGDPVAQTHETLDNIAALVSHENLCRHGLAGMGASLDDLAVARVYIKRQADYEKCRAVCEERLGGVPTTYVVADICRPELLVEIEAIASARKTPATQADVGGGERGRDYNVLHTSA